MSERGRRSVELRRSGAAGVHGDRRLARLRTRAAGERAALDEELVDLTVVDDPPGEPSRSDDDLAY